jgi:hypothetical protein
MPESPEDLYARVMESADADGRLPMPPIATWDIFPWDGEISTRPLQPPVSEEPVREGAPGGTPCGRCADPSRNVIWENERWTVSSTSSPSGMPLIVFLMPKEHLDYADLDDDMAAECGRLSVWLTRIIERLDGIGRVHVMKIGDGAEHLHVWFFARPAGLLQVRGSAVPEWDDILPPVPEEIWRADLAQVARHLATHEGRVVG